MTFKGQNLTFKYIVESALKMYVSMRGSIFATIKRLTLSLSIENIKCSTDFLEVFDIFHQTMCF